MRGGTYAGTGVIGTGTTWNGVADGSTAAGTVFDLVDENGAATNIDISSTSIFSRTSSVRILNGTEELGDFVDTGGRGPYTVTLSDLVAIPYDLVLFGVDGHFDRGANFTLGTVDVDDDGEFIFNGPTKSTTGATNATFVEFDNYVQFLQVVPTFNLTSNSNEIVITVTGDELAHINGLQLRAPDVDPQDLLMLEVNTTNGLATIINESLDDWDIDTYQISSNPDGVGSLDPTWGGLPGWSKGGASDANLLTDFNLASSTVLAPDDSLSIGRAFDTAVGNEDLEFSYTRPNGATTTGSVRYVDVSFLGDYNVNGKVEGADFLKWQRGESPNPLSPSDLADWESNYGTGVGALGDATAVPEPATAALAFLGLVGAIGIAGRRQMVRKDSNIWLEPS